MNSQEEDEILAEMSVEVVGIPRKKKKKKWGGKSSSNNNITSSVCDQPGYMVLDHMVTKDNLVEISLQEGPKAPSVTPKTPRIRHPAGTVLHPTIGCAVRPSLKPKDSDATTPITHVDGDPFPPCFRVVGVSPTPDQQQQQRQNHDRSPVELSVSKKKVPSVSVNTSMLSTLTDEQDDDDDSTHFNKTREMYLQLDLPSTNARQDSSVVDDDDIFQDEEVGVPPSRQRSVMSHHSQTTTRDYLKLTQELMKQRKGHERREGKKRQQQEKRERSRRSTTTEKQQTKPWQFRTVALMFVGVVLLIGVGLTVMILAVTQFQVFKSSSDSSNEASAINSGSQETIIDTGTAPAPQEQLAGSLATSPPAQSPAMNNMPTPDSDWNEPLQMEDFPEATALVLSANDPSSPQVKAYQWLLQDPYIRNYPQWQQFQRMALATLYYSTNGDQWKGDTASTWLNYDGNECWWNSDACDRQGNVRRLLLPDTGLDGTLPYELFWLTSLQQLQLQDNPNLVGHIPTVLGRLTDLQVLWVQRSGLSSQGRGPALPTEIGRLGNSLLYLDLSENPLGHADGSIALSTNRDSAGSAGHNDIPTEIGLLTNLQELILGDSSLEGTLPTEIGLLTALQYSLQIQKNSLSGTLPSELSALSVLENLFAEENHFSGQLPALRLAQTKVIDFSSNHLEGSLPQLRLMTALEELWLFDNLISGSIGELPTSLISLDVSMNQFSRLPPNVGSLTNLRGLWAYSNALVGATIPTDFGLLHANLRQLSLFSSSLVGTIPGELAYLTKLRGLWLDDNELVGSIPEMMGTLTNLIACHLQRNFLQGTIPSFPRNPYYAMQDLRLDSNLISGTIPESISNLHNNLEFLRLDSNQLSGFVPTELGSLTNLVEVTLHGNQFWSGAAIPRELCNVKLSPDEMLDISIDCSQISCNCDCSCHGLT